VLRSKPRSRTVDQVMGMLRTCVNFICTLAELYRERLPENVRILEQICLLSPDHCLRAVKQLIAPLARLMHIPDEVIIKIVFQWKKINLLE